MIILSDHEAGNGLKTSRVVLVFNLEETTLRGASVASRVDRSAVVDRDHVGVPIQGWIPEMVTASTVVGATVFLEDLMQASGADRAAGRVVEPAAVR